MTTFGPLDAPVDKIDPSSAMARQTCSILYSKSKEAMADGGESEPNCFHDLLLEQVFSSINKDRNDYQLLPFFYDHLHDADEIRFRYEVWRDLENPTLITSIRTFASQMREVHQRLAWSAKSSFVQHRRALHLDAAHRYCNAVGSLARALEETKINSGALVGFRESLSAYTSSSPFEQLSNATRLLKDQLSQVRYCINLKGLHVRVVKYEGEEDYGAEIIKTFERFQQSTVKDYRRSISEWPNMNHVEAMIVDRVALLFSDLFSSIESFCEQESDFLNQTVTLFEREIQFYLSYLDFIAPLKAQGLSFCIPEILETSKEISAVETFDLALAHKLELQRMVVVRNDLHLEGIERIIVVSGPNQGGKTTFARTFGQIHYLASIGCLVPGQRAQLYLYDELYTHFGKEEDPTYQSGKLEEDLIRIRAVLNQATSNSIIIMNEIFASTTALDALGLGLKVIDKIQNLDALCVVVTFIDELSRIGPWVVSMTSTINPTNPADRTFKIVRQPADGLAYALAIAQKYQLTYDDIRGRLKS